MNNPLDRVLSYLDDAVIDERLIEYAETHENGKSLLVSWFMVRRRSIPRFPKAFSLALEYAKSRLDDPDGTPFDCILMVLEFA